MSHTTHSPETTRSAELSEFLLKTLGNGIDTPSVIGVLAANGWREKDIYRALGNHFRNTLGVDVPRRTHAGAAAKDAFFYLLIFSTLATWTLGLGTLAFQLIDRWLADPLFSPYGQQFETYEITWSLAAILVAFPLYLLLSRTVLHDQAADPEKLEAGIRKWLTYMALVIAASIFMGDLIRALAFLLRGEITSRFLAKAFVVLALSGGVFFYYFGGLRNTEIKKAGRDRAMAIISSAAVTLMLVLGFLQLGAPRNQRALRADEQRVQQIYQLASQVQTYWNSHASQLPPSTDALNGQHLDPETRRRFDYHPGQGSQYRLCATFAKPSASGKNFPDSATWTHPAGPHCFQLDASAQLPYPIE
jgi:hypothetical protein